MGSILAIFTLNHYPLRARARTMICQKCRFIKNGIKMDPTDTLDDPKMGPILGPTYRRVGMVIQFILVYTCI